MSFLSIEYYAKHSYIKLQYNRKRHVYDFLQINNHPLFSKVEALYNEHLLYELFVNEILCKTLIYQAAVQQKIPLI